MKIELKIKDWNIEELTGYKPITSFYRDFSIADNFGIDAIKDTYNRAFNEWKNDCKYLTELVMVLNWKIWEHNDSNNNYSELYSKLWLEADEFARNNLKDDEMSYFYDITD